MDPAMNDHTIRGPFRRARRWLSSWPLLPVVVLVLGFAFAGTLIGMMRGWW